MAQEVLKILLHHRENGGHKAPEVHGHHGVAGQVHPLAAVDVGDGAVGEELNLQRLLDEGQVAVPGLADAPGDGAVLGDGVLQQVAHHGGVAVLGQAHQLLIDGAVGVHAVIVVGIDDAEGLVDHVPGAQNGVAGAEGLGALFGDVVELGDAVIGLVGVRHLHLAAVGGGELLHHVAAHGADQVQNLRLDDEHDLVKTGANGVKHAVLHQKLAVGADAVHLLVAAVAGAHTGSHNHQCSLCHIEKPPEMIVVAIWFHHHTTIYPDGQPLNRIWREIICSFWTKNGI